MQDGETLKAKLLRCWPAMAWAATALAVALVGLPTQTDGPLHHWLLAYLVVASVIAATLFCGVRAGSKARTALLSFAVSIVFMLNLSAFNTLLARNDAGFDFLAVLVGAQPQTIRASLVLLFAIFATLLTTTWRHVLGVGDARGISSGEDVVSNGVSAGRAATGQVHHRPKRASPPRSASAPENMAHLAGEQVRGHDEPGTGVQPNGRHQTSTCDALAPSSAFAGDRWRASHIALSALPLLAFLVVCISPVGNSGPRDLSTDQARLGSSTEQAPAASTAIPAARAEAPPPQPRATAYSPPSGPKRTKRGGARRLEVGARGPP